MFPKKGQVKLTGPMYQVWKNNIHELDSWTCRICRKVNPGLTVHHLIKRSQRRLDVDWNGISLCFTCHDRVERREIYLTWECVDRRIPKITFGRLYGRS